MANLRKKTVVVELPSKIDLVIEFLRSKAGHATVIIAMAALLSILTAFLFAEVLKDIRGWEWAAIGLGLLFAIGLEFGVFFLAINGYSIFSVICALMSIVMARATFTQLFDASAVSIIEIDTWTAQYMATWVMSLFPPVLVAFISHKLNEKFELEDLARLKELNRECVVCKKIFEGESKYCSQACKQKAHRQRKEARI